MQSQISLKFEPKWYYLVDIINFSRGGRPDRELRVQPTPADFDINIPIENQFHDVIYHYPFEDGHFAYFWGSQHSTDWLHCYYFFKPEADIAFQLMSEDTRQKVEDDWGPPPDCDESQYIDPLSLSQLNPFTEEKKTAIVREFENRIDGIIQAILDDQERFRQQYKLLNI